MHHRVDHEAGYDVVVVGGRQSRQKNRRPQALTYLGSVDVVARIEEVELSSRRNQALVLDHCFLGQRLVIDYDDCRFLILAVPNGEPDFVTVLVELTLHHAALAFRDPRPFTDWKHRVFWLLIGEISNLKDCD